MKLAKAVSPAVSDGAADRGFEGHGSVLARKLNHVLDAEWNSPARKNLSGCLLGTRTELLDMIHDWVLHGKENLFWLNGITLPTDANSMTQQQDKNPSRQQAKLHRPVLRQSIDTNVASTSIAGGSFSPVQGLFGRL